MDPFLETEFLSKGVSGRKVELDEVIEPSLELESAQHRKMFRHCLHQLERKLMIVIMKLRT